METKAKRTAQDALTNPKAGDVVGYCGKEVAVIGVIGGLVTAMMAGAPLAFTTKEWRGWMQRLNAEVLHVAD